MATEDSSEQIPKQTERVPGTTILPLARVKRIIKEDRDVNLINPEATFCVTYATVYQHDREALGSTQTT